MTLSELTPDIALAAMLDGKIRVNISATESRAVAVYPTGKQPNKDVGDEYLTIQWNGGARSRSERLGIFQGNLALTVNCKLQTNNTIKANRIKQIVALCQNLIHRKRSGGFFFTFNPMNVITPSTPNLTIGYSTTILNVEWHT